MLEGNVLITGGAGFLARAIYRRAQRQGWSARFTALSRDDAKHAALQQRFPHVQTVLGDVGKDPVEKLTDIMRGFDVVIHAAASKYVDRAEHQAADTIETNVIGSLQVAEAARRARVGTVLGISTDKATAPVNNYGATKFLMERIFQEAARLSDTRFVLCRYGNVMASTGSVLAIFRELVRLGKPIQLTDPQMTRFWMTADEAIDTILGAYMAPNGTVTIPKCRAMSMRELVLTALGRDELNDLPEDGSVEIVGIRPGEKRHEALVQAQESVRIERVYHQYGGQHPDNWEWLRIHPPDTPIRNESAFEVRSDAPPGGWISRAEMRAAVADAENI